MQTLLFSSILSLERDSAAAGFCLFSLLVTTSLRKIVIHGLGNCPRWFYNMTLLQFVSKTKHELRWKGSLALVGCNSSGTFGKKPSSHENCDHVSRCACEKKEKNYFCFQTLSLYEKKKSLIHHNNKYIMPILWPKIKLKCQKCAGLFLDKITFV